MTSIRLLAVALAFGIASGAALGCGKGGASEEETAAAALLGQKAPPLAADGIWVQGKPFSLDALGGKAALVEFGFAGCKWCAAAQPTLESLAKEYGPRGLEIVWVNDGRYAELADVQAIVRDRHLTIPVLHDPRGATVDAYKVAAYPHAFVVGRNGTVVWQGLPLRREKDLEKAIVAALK